MAGWLESVVGPDYATALMWTIVALIVLLVLLILIRIARGFGVGTFVAGGRNRKARLAVMDATAVDSHRRLVLVRRDDVEHLILIGGPTDVVVEQNIRLVAPARRPADEDAHTHRAPAAATAAEQPRAQPPMQPAPRPTPPAAPRPASVAPVVAPSTVTLSAPPPSAPAPAIRPEPRVQQTAPSAAALTPADAPTVSPTRPVDTPRKNELDETLLHELELSLDREPTPVPQPPAVARSPQAPAAAGNDTDSTLDEEMSRLLNDLAGKR